METKNPRDLHHVKIGAAFGFCGCMLGMPALIGWDEAWLNIVGRLGALSLLMAGTIIVASAKNKLKMGIALSFLTVFCGLGFGIMMVIHLIFEDKEPSKRKN